MPGLVRSEVRLWLVALAALMALALAWAAGRRSGRAPGAAGAERAAYAPEAVHPASLPAADFGGAAPAPA